MHANKRELIYKDEEYRKLAANTNCEELLAFISVYSRLIK